MSGLKQVTIYTDGACVGNPGPGGYGICLIYKEREKELSGGFRRTTNNRMEIMAAILGLETLTVEPQAGSRPCLKRKYSQVNALSKIKNPITPNIVMTFISTTASVSVPCLLTIM